MRQTYISILRGINVSGQKMIKMNNPFIGDLSKDESFLHITFLASRPDAQYLPRLNEIYYPDEEF
jgi:uncharacterized protein (DUF1697 family)